MRLASLLVVGLLASASAAGAQMIVDPPEDQHPARDDSTVEKMLSDAERDRAAAQTNSRKSRVALEQWAGCLARKNPDETRRVLSMDSTAPAYDRALMMLSQEDKSCMKARGKLQASGLLFAGELAEALIEEGPVPLGSRLAKAATQPAASTYSFSDRLAMCLVRSVPDQVAAIFPTTRDSREESAAIGALNTPAQMCATVARSPVDLAGKAAGKPRPMSISPAALRAMVATAALRSVANGGERS